MNYSGVVDVLYRFQGSSQGANPNTLTEAGGAFYSTTQFGGAEGVGTVFAISASGVESVLYNFKGGDDGAQPDNAPIDVGGSLYGTTYEGGGNGCKTQSTLGCGVIFAVKQH